MELGWYIEVMDPPQPVVDPRAIKAYPSAFDQRIGGVSRAERANDPPIPFGLMFKTLIGIDRAHMVVAIASGYEDLTGQLSKRGHYL